MVYKWCPPGFLGSGCIFVFTFVNKTNHTTHSHAESQHTSHRRTPRTTTTTRPVQCNHSQRKNNKSNKKTNPTGTTTQRTQRTTATQHGPWPADPQNTGSTGGAPQFMVFVPTGIQPEIALLQSRNTFLGRKQKKMVACFSVV